MLSFVCQQDFKPPTRPFRRMNYVDAIKYLKEHDIKKEDGTYYEFGEVSVVFVLFVFVFVCLFCFFLWGGGARA